MIALALAWLASLQVPIVDVEVRGNRVVSPSSIRHHARIDEGVSEQELPEAFRRLWETGLFEDVRFETELASGGVRLVIQVQEKPLLRKTRILGERLRESELRDALKREGFPLEPNHPMGTEDAREVGLRAQKILGRDYEVRARLEAVSDVQADLVLEVAPRAWSRVESLAFEGNQAITDDELRRVMQTRPKGFLSGIGQRDRYDPDTLDADLDRLRSLYGHRGYARASVGPASVESGSGGTVRVEIPIVEGDEHRFGAIEVEPGSLLSLEEARALLPASGGLYDRSALDSASDRLKRRYFALGYPSVRIDREETGAPGSRVIDVRLRVVEGPFVRVGFIRFHGHRRHRDGDLRPFLELSESERFDPSRIDDSVQALMSFGDFTNVASTVDPEARPGRADIDFHVEEKKPFEYLVGGGVNGTEGGTGSGELVARNLLGRSETLRLQLDLGDRFQSVVAGYREPSILGRRIFFAADYRSSRLDYPDETSEDMTDLSFRVGGPAGSERQLLAGFRLSAFTLGTSLEGDVPFLTPYVGMTFHTYRSSAAFARQTADRPLFASRGSRLSVAYELVTGGVELHRLSLEGTKLFPLDSNRRQILALSGRAAAVRPFGETAANGVPRFERLFLGSENDLRGFPIRGVGPHSGADNVGGDRLAFGSVEYRRSLFSRVRAVGFFDLGNVYATDFEDSSQPRLRYDAGGEAQILVPVANVPFRLGYGWNLDPLPDEPRGRFFVSFDLRF